jgi:hypothetical protein
VREAISDQSIKTSNSSQSVTARRSTYSSGTAILFADIKQHILARMRTALDEIEQNAPTDRALFE